MISYKLNWTLHRKEAQIHRCLATGFVKTSSIKTVSLFDWEKWYKYKGKGSYIIKNVKPNNLDYINQYTPML